MRCFLYILNTYSYYRYPVIHYNKINGAQVAKMHCDLFVAFANACAVMLISCAQVFAPYDCEFELPHTCNCGKMLIHA